MLKHSHQPQAIAKRLADQPRNSYLRDWIYGGIDGTVTTFAVVSGVVGAHLSALVILILGVANLIADGFSMAASNYLGTKAEEDRRLLYEAYEKEQIEKQPQGETEEIRQIYKNKGFSGNELEGIVKHIVADKKLWLETMMHEEYGLSGSPISAIKAAFSTFIAFLLCGIVPLLPYILDAPKPFLLSCSCTGLVFFVIGSVKSKWTIRSWWRSGISTLVIGGIAATIAYAIGLLFHTYS